MNVYLLFLPFAARGNPCAESGPKNAYEYYTSNFKDKLRNLGINSKTKIIPYHDDSNADIYLSEVYNSFEKCFKVHDIIFIFGGNHLSIQPIYKYLLEKPNNFVLNLDAHRDIYKSNNTLTHGSFIKYIKIDNQSKLVNFGYRDYLEHKKDTNYFNKTFSIFELDRLIKYLDDIQLGSFNTMLVDIDVDVFDPSVFPYSSTNMAMGMGLATTQELFFYLSQKLPKIISFSEYSPVLDHRNIGIEFIYKLIEFLICNTSKSVQ